MSDKIDRMQRLARLRERLASAEEANKKDLAEEHQRKSIDAKEEAKRLRKQQEANDILMRQKAAEAGEDFDRIQARHFTAEDVEKWNEKQQRREKKKDHGFVDWNEANLRKHERLVDQMKPDLNAYQKLKTKRSVEDAFRDADSLAYADPQYNAPAPAALDKMANDLEEQLEKRAKHSRHRKVDPDADISYINRKNMHFNKQIARHYDKYTEEIRENFERGTAL